jgi:hypothetical protein
MSLDIASKNCISLLQAQLNAGNILFIFDKENNSVTRKR